jgi:hypothetical protein
MSVVHRVRLPVGAVAMVEPGHAVEPAEVLATRRTPGAGTTIQVASRLRRSATDAAACLQVLPGALLEPGAPIAADDRGREVRAPYALLYLGYDREDGSALVAPLGGNEPVLGHVRGEVTVVEPEGIEIEVAGALVSGVGGTGAAVHGELRVAVRDPGEELRASAIDTGATDRIVVGGSRASAETLTRARAMGVAGIVLGGLLDKELRDFEAVQQRRHRIGGSQRGFAILVLEGYGKVGLDPRLFAWFQAHEGRMASLFGETARLYVYDAGRPPARRGLPGAGDRVIAHRRPNAGRTGHLLRVLPMDHAAASGVSARAAIVRFDDGHTAVVPLPNLEALEVTGA